MLKSSLTERLFIPHLVRVTQDINDGDSCPACPLLGRAAGPRGTWGGEAVRLEPPQTGAWVKAMGPAAWAGAAGYPPSTSAGLAAPGAVPLGDCAIWLFR